MNLLRTIFIIFAIVLYQISFSQTYSSSKVKAIWIYNIIEETTWPDENFIDTFHIGMYNPESEFQEYLKLIATNKIVKNRPLVIHDLSQVNIPDLQMIYVNNARDSLLDFFLNAAHENQVLSLLDNGPSSLGMIQFVQKNKSLNIDINYSLLEDKGFKISPRLVAMVTQSEELKQLYIEAEQKLAKEQDIVKQQKEEISIKEAELEKISLELEVKNAEIEKQKALLLKQEKDIKYNKQHLIKLNNQIQGRQADLQTRIEELEEKEREIQNQKDVIAIQQSSINDQFETLSAQQAEIDVQKSRIKQQEEQLYDLIGKGESQTIIIRLTLILLLLAIIFAIYIARSLNIKKKINRTLEKQNNEILDKNEEIQQQKEELRAKAELLIDVNQELEKLSLVAKKTDNAISIYNADGELEWVNDSFVKYYHRDLEQFVSDFGKNLKSHSRSDNIIELLDEATKTKSSVKYQNKWISETNKEVWFQSTLTPILDDENNIKRFIVVDSEITKIKQAQELIDQKNKDITDSIRYAQRIQSAILPGANKINKAFENSFVYFTPRDIISGDFYWFHVKKNRIYLAVADCTGHGVPGALMSVIGYSLLNKIVANDKNGDPAKILFDLRKEVILTLQQSFSKEYPLDGMDISVCVYDTKDHNLLFSGANQQIYLIRNQEIYEFKGDPMPIALFEKMGPFSNTKIELEKEDMIYLFSDGYADQIGGKKGKKFKYKRFREMLKNISSLPLSEQKQVIEKEFEKWKQNFEQIDDVIVMGIRI